MEKKEIKIPVLALIYIGIFLFAVMNISGFLNSHILVHIRTGEWMLESGKILSKDIFSNGETKEWINYYWLTDILYATLYKYFGIGSILIMHAVIIAGTFSIVVLFLYKKRVNVIIGMLFFILGLYSSLTQWSALPYSFNFLFLMLFIYWFDSYYQNGNKKELIFIIILQLFWVNMNSEFFYPIIVILAYIISDILMILKKEERESGRLKRIVILLLFLLPIMIINPYGVKECLNVITEYIFLIKDRRNDWVSPDFHEFAKYSNMLLAFSLMLIFLFKKENLKEERKYIIIYLFVMFVFLYAQKHIMIFSLISIIFLPLILEYDKNIENNIINLIYKKTRKISDKIYESTSAKTINVGLILIITIMFAISIKTSEENLHEIMSSWARSSGVKYLKENKIEGNGFHSDGQGDMIIWYNYPESKVFIDSREGIYTWKYQNDYSKVMLLKEGWEKILEKNRINWILLQQSQLTNILKILDDKWVVVYESRASVLFLKKEYYEKVKDKIKIVKE